MNKKLICLLLVLVMLFSVTGCGAKSEVQKVVDKFETSCKKLDMEGILDCIDPVVSKPIRFILNAASLLTGQISDETVDQILNEVVPALFGNEYNPRDYLNGFAIKDETISVSGDRATVLCKIVNEVNGQKYEKDATITLKQQEKQWYITGVKFD